MQDRHPALGAEDQSRMMLLPVSLVSLATLPSISLVQDGRVSAHNTSKEGSSSGTETNLCGPYGLVSTLSQDHIQCPIVSWITSASLAALDVQAHLLGGGCMTDTAIAETRSLGGSCASSAIEDIRRVVRN